MYEWALDFVGGGQKYSCHIASILQKEHEVTFVCRKPVKKEFLENAYEVDLSNVNFKQLKFKPLIEKIPAGLYNTLLIQLNAIREAKEITPLTKQYDLFINCESTRFQIKPLSKKSILICPFPPNIKKWIIEYDKYSALLKYSYALPYKLIAKKLEFFFYVKSYTKIIANSNFTKGWIKKYWDCDSEVLYPCTFIPYERSPNEKENIIITVSRIAHKKKIIEMIDTFKILCTKGSKNWKLIIVGSTEDPMSKYLDVIYKNIEHFPVFIKLNISSKELNEIYNKSKIYWHMTGLGIDADKNPNDMEHFGMTPIEAMSHYVVPILFNGGGLKEIVTNGINGFLVNNQEELIERTMQLINDDNRWKEISKNAFQRSKYFSFEEFSKNLKTLLEKLDK